jgi:hypothetical protein
MLNCTSGRYRGAQRRTFAGVGNGANGVRTRDHSHRDATKRLAHGLESMIGGTGAVDRRIRIRYRIFDG